MSVYLDPTTTITEPIRPDGCTDCLYMKVCSDNILSSKHKL